MFNSFYFKDVYYSNEGVQRQLGGVSASGNGWTTAIYIFFCFEKN